MRLYLVIFTIICMYFSANSETIVPKKGHFVYLHTDSLIIANSVEFKKCMKKSNHLLSGMVNSCKSHFLLDDSLRLELSSVKFFRNDSGFFALSVRHLTDSDAYSFARRVYAGNLNLYQKVSKIESSSHGYFMPGMATPGGLIGGGFSPGYSREVKKIRNYYNKGFEDLKVLNYKNLKSDIYDYPKSQVLLDKYKKQHATQVALILTGAGFLAGGSIALFSFTLNDENDDQNYEYDEYGEIIENSDKYEKPNVVPGIVCLGIGGVSILVSIPLGKAKNKNLDSAVDAYLAK